MIFLHMYYSDFRNV